MTPAAPIQTTMLGGPELPPGVTLTVRQAVFFEYLREHEPVASDELGALAHSRRRRRRHSTDTRCALCGRDGQRVGRELERKGLATFTTGIGWTVNADLRSREGRPKPAAKVAR